MGVRARNERYAVLFGIRRQALIERYLVWVIVRLNFKIVVVPQQLFKPRVALIKLV